MQLHWALHTPGKRGDINTFCSALCSPRCKDQRAKEFHAQATAAAAACKKAPAEEAYTRTGSTLSALPCDLDCDVDKVLG